MYVTEDTPPCCPPATTTSPHVHAPPLPRPNHALAASQLCSVYVDTRPYSACLAHPMPNLTNHVICLPPVGTRMAPRDQRSRDSGCSRPDARDAHRDALARTRCDKNAMLRRTEFNSAAFLRCCFAVWGGGDECGVSGRTGRAVSGAVTGTCHVTRAGQVVTRRPRSSDPTRPEHAPPDARACPSENDRLEAAEKDGDVSMTGIRRARRGWTCRFLSACCCRMVDT